MAQRRSVAFLAAAFVLMLSVVTPAAADSPTQTLRAFFSQANRIVLSPDPDFLVEARRHIIRTLAYDVFDFHDAAALALGPEWQARTPAERKEFTRLFADLLETGYIAMMGSKASMQGGLAMDYVGEVLERDTATVRTVVLTRNGADLPVDYRMVRAGGRWRVRDVNIDGLSLVANYRAQFQRVIQMSSYGDLVARMRARAPDAPPVAVASAPEPVTAARPAVADWRVVSPALVDVPPSPPAAPVAAVEPVVAAVEPVAVGEPAAAVATPVVAAPEPMVVPVADVAGAAPPATGRFWVQVGAFRDDDSVIDVMQRLRQHAVTLFNTAESMPGGARQPVARVLVGPFARWAEADAKLRELQAGGFRPFIAEVRE